MFSLLFDTSFWYDVLTAIIILVCIVLIFKYKEARVYVFTLLFSLIFICSIYCDLQLVYYYTDKGGILGSLNDPIDQNGVEVIVDDNIKFDVKNLVLTQEEDSLFSAEIYSNESIKLEGENQYMLFVNGQPCSNVNYDLTYMKGTYEYVFKDENLDELCRDSLNLSFAFFKNGYSLKISTNGGQTAVDYWTKYFSNEDFVVSIEKIDGANVDEDLEYGEADTSYFHKINYYIEGELIEELVQKKDTFFNELEMDKNDGTSFSGWFTGDNVSFTQSDKITKDLNVYGYYKYDFTFDEEKLTGYTGTDTIVIVPSSYSFNNKGEYVEGDDVKVTSIKSSAFSGLNFENITIPNTVTSIGAYVFEDCSKLVTVKLSSNIQEISPHLFDGCVLLKNIIIPMVTQIGTSAFSNCSSIEAITIPSTCLEVGFGAFSGCTSLTNVTFKLGVQKISQNAFSNCSNLVSIILPTSIQEIQPNAFLNTALETIRINASTPPKIYEDSIPLGVFVYVPSAALETYKYSEYWSKMWAFLKGF